MRSAIIVMALSANVREKKENGRVMFFLNRSRKFKARRCPHVHLQSIHGDVVEVVGGFRLQCTDCWRYLDGPAQLAWVDRDPTRLVPSQND